MRKFVKLAARVAVDAMVLDLYHSLERGTVRRLRAAWRARRSADG